jgi:uncharacterized SAM-binding protein YcdF (DUF218 family)
VCIVAWTLVAWPLAAWAAAGALVVRSEMPRADALAVLAGASTYIERTHRAAELFHEGRAPQIILTNDEMQGGYSPALDRNPFFVERAAEELRRMGVPAESIKIIPQPLSSTYEEAVCLREYAAAHDLHSILVVTSAYHSRRALWTLRRVFRGSDVMVGLDPAATGQQSPAPAAWWWHELGWRLVPGEYLKLAYYVVYYR